MILVPDEPLFEKKTNGPSDKWTTVSNSRKNKYNNHIKNVFEEINEVFNDNPDLPNESLEGDLYLDQKESESKYDCAPIKDLCLIPEANPVEELR